MNLEHVLIRWEFVPKRTQHGRARSVRLFKQGVNVRQERVSLANRLTNDCRALVTEQPRLAALRLQMRVSTKERIVSADLVPPRHELSVGIAKKSSDVGAAKRQPAHAEREHHR